MVRNGVTLCGGLMATTHGDKAKEGPWEITFSHCPHLAPNEEGFRESRIRGFDSNGMAVNLSPDHTSYLILCPVCAELVRAHVLQTVIQESLSGAITLKLNRWQQDSLIRP